MFKGDDSKFKIFVVYHRGVDKLRDDFNDRTIFQPIQGGAAIEKNEKIENSLYDNDDKDNYSSLNLYINEWSAYYWLYKNVKNLYPNLKALGIFHYSKFLYYDLNKINQYIENENRFFISSLIKLKYTNHYDFGLSHILWKKEMFDNEDVDKEIIGCLLCKEWLNLFLIDFLLEYPKYRLPYEHYMFFNHMFVEANMFISDIKTFAIYGNFIEENIMVYNKLINSNRFKNYIEFINTFFKTGKTKAVYKRMFALIAEVMTGFFVYLLKVNFFKIDNLIIDTARKVIFDDVRNETHNNNIKKYECN